MRQTTVGQDGHDHENLRIATKGRAMFCKAACAEFLLAATAVEDNNGTEDDKLQLVSCKDSVIDELCKTASIMAQVSAQTDQTTSIESVEQTLLQGIGAQGASPKNKLEKKIINLLNSLRVPKRVAVLVTPALAMLVSPRAPKTSVSIALAVGAAVVFLPGLIGGVIGGLISVTLVACALFVSLHVGLYMSARSHDRKVDKRSEFLKRVISGDLGGIDGYKEDTSQNNKSESNKPGTIGAHQHPKPVGGRFFDKHYWINSARCLRRC